MKRKARNKINKERIDMTKPIDITIFGTDEDPCFGKHYDNKAPECQRCGDSEICSIIYMQKQNLLREKIEEETKFKDITNEVEPLQIKRKTSKYIRSRLKKVSRIKLASLYNYVKNEYTENPPTKKEVTKMVRSIVKKSKKMKIVKTKKGIRYVTTK